MSQVTDDAPRPGDRSSSPRTPPTRDASTRATHRAREHALDPLFAPRNVAVIGASEEAGSVGAAVLWNLISHPFGGTVFPVNPKRSNVLGIRAYPTIANLPETVDLAVIVTPAADVPETLRECGEAGARGAIVLSSGFSEIGAEGLALERAVVEEGRRQGMRIVGPNCLGVMSPVSGLNATCASAMARPGNVAFVSQSGALSAAVLDWSLSENVGFSAFVSLGSMADVGWGDVIDYLGGDARTRSIVIYMESVGHARAFMSAAREVALQKPIIVIKAGRTAAAARAAESHTGSLTGSDDVLDAVFRRCGVLRVDHLSELFNMAEVLAKQPRPRGPRLTVITNAGAAGVLALDALVGNGGQLAELSDETVAGLNALLPPEWSHANPIDLLGDATPERYARAVEVAAKDPGSDGLLVVLTPQLPTNPTLTAESLKQLPRLTDKPLLASWMGGAEVATGEAILNRADIPTFAYPDTAARTFTHMWRYSSNLRALYETPILPAGVDERGEEARRRAEAVIQQVRRSGRTLLTEIESKALLAAYGVPVVDTRPAADADRAVATARALGYPVVVKLLSETVAHKQAAGGVRLDLRSDDAVRSAFEEIRLAAIERAGEEGFGGVTVQPMISHDGYELILGSSLDPQFGPVLLFGLGGTFVDVLRDRALGLPPLNTTLARRLMEQTRVFSLLRGARGRPVVDVEALQELLVRFSHLVAEQRWISQIDVNPMIAAPGRLVAADARVLVHGLEVEERDLPALAIRPYPTQYVAQWTLKDGTSVTIRPIRPEDEPLMVRFHETLSERSVYFRYFHMIKLGMRVSHERLTRICFIDYDRDMALVADGVDASGARAIVGVGRLTQERGTNCGEFAIVVSDGLQGQGLGTELLRRVVQVGRDRGLERITADILPENRDMQRVAEKVGFTCTLDVEAGVVRADLTL